MKGQDYEKNRSGLHFLQDYSKKIPADIVYEDNNILAFNDIKPQAPYHILVIPKEHIPGINYIESSNKEEISHILEIIRDLARQKKLDNSGYRVVINSGRDAGQEVQHIHFHVLGGRKLNWPPG